MLKAAFIFTTKKGSIQSLGERKTAFWRTESNLNERIFHPNLLSRKEKEKAELALSNSWVVLPGRGFPERKVKQQKSKQPLIYNSVKNSTAPHHDLTALELDICHSERAFTYWSGLSQLLWEEQSGAWGRKEAASDTNPEHAWKQIAKGRDPDSQMPLLGYLPIGLYKCMCPQQPPSAFASLKTHPVGNNRATNVKYPRRAQSPRRGPARNFMAWAHLQRRGFNQQRTALTLKEMAATAEQPREKGH